MNLPVLDVTKDLTTLGYPANAIPDILNGGAPIQSAINEFIANPGRWYAIWIPEATYKISTPLRVLDSTSGKFMSVTMISKPRGFAATNWPLSLRSARIELHGVSARQSPVLLVQGGRMCVFQGLQFVNTGNPKPKEIADLGILKGLFENPEFDDWVSPNTRANPYSPCCAVVIDPFMEQYPDNDSANAYPGLLDYYGGSKLANPMGSSATQFIGCSFEGGVVGVAMSPTGPGVDGPLIQNNENSSFERCYWQYNTIHFSSGQSQERGTNIESPSMYGGWITLDDSFVGPGGNTGVPPHLSGAPNIGGTRYLFNLNSGQNTHYSKLYVESTASLGKLGTGFSSARSSVKLTGCLFNLATAAAYAPNEPEVEYHLATWHTVALEACTFNGTGISGTKGRPFSVWNAGKTGGRTIFQACQWGDAAINDHVQVGFQFTDEALVLEQIRTRSTAGTSIYNTAPKLSPGFTITNIDKGTILQVIQDATVKSRGTVTVSNTSDLEVGMVIRLANTTPTQWIPQTLNNTQYAYSSHAPVGRIESIINDTSITIVGLPFGFPFACKVVLEGITWNNSGGSD